MSAKNIMKFESVGVELISGQSEAKSDALHHALNLYFGEGIYLPD